jgi:site-specific DNA recombinase
MTLSLAFLSPKVVQAIIAGRLPRGIGMTALADLPPSWNAQHAALGA